MMTGNIVDMDRHVQAKLPFWFVEMAKEVGAKRKRRESIAQVVVRIAGAALRREHERLPKLQPTKV